jgi:hypothetical protein
MEYPETPKARAKTARNAPEIHVNSRGFLNPPAKDTRLEWSRIARRIKLDAQR